MTPDDLITRAEASAKVCEAQGFASTARALRALAAEANISHWILDQANDAEGQQDATGCPPTHPRY